MKNLPDKFPIRYVLVIENWDDEDFDKEILLPQYLNLLQKNPLDYSLLNPSYFSVRFQVLGKEIFKITKIQAEEGWLELAKVKIREIMPDVSVKGWETSSPFNIGLYSYKKSAEIPAFIRFYNEFNKNTNSASYFYKIFKDVKNGKYDDWAIYQILNDYFTSTKRNLYYSNVWKELDRNKEINGLLRTFKHIQSLNLRNILKALPKDGETIEKIPVLICKSWEELFAEEVFALYKMFNYCNNCGKALPFNYNGKYCPDEPENVDCIRERARKRKHSQDND